MLEKLRGADRRYIFLIVGLAIVVSLAFEIKLPVQKVSEDVENFKKVIDEAPESSVILISFDFDPASSPEIKPVGEGLLYYALKNNKKVIMTTLWQTGIGLTETVMTSTVAILEKEGIKKVYGKDYAYLGWIPGVEAAVIKMGQNFPGAFPNDYNKKPASELEIMKNIRTLKDFSVVVSLTAGTPGSKEWVIYGVAPHGIKLLLASTGVIIPEVTPYIKAKQVQGFVGGLRGAAEFEKAIGRQASATGGMGTISMTHFLMIFLILASNVIFFISRGVKKQ